MKHWSEKATSRMVQAFAEDNNLGNFHHNPDDRGPDSYATAENGDVIWFEVKSCKVRVGDASSPSGDRPGRFRIDPKQHKGRYGTDKLWYVLVVYNIINSGTERDIIKVTFIRSDYLPQRTTIISLTALKGKNE